MNIAWIIFNGQIIHGKMHMKTNNKTEQIHTSDVMSSTM